MGASLTNWTDLAYALHVHGRDDNALTICEVVMKAEFKGDFRAWSPVERALALGARLRRTSGDKSAATAAVQRIRDAGYVSRRCDGSLLSHTEIDRCAASG